jgi:hypothetical protein
MLEPLIDPRDSRRRGARLLGDLTIGVTLIKQPDHCPSVRKVCQFPKGAEVTEEGSSLILGAEGQDGIEQGSSVIGSPSVSCGHAS